MQPIDLQSHAPHNPPGLLRALLLASLIPAGLAGCSGYQDPTFRVVSAKVVERSDTAAVLSLTVEATNTNDVELPLRSLDYSFNLDGFAPFSGVRSPEATLRRQGTQPIIMPAVIALPQGSPPQGEIPFQLTGSVVYITPGALAETLFDTGVRRPSAAFDLRGTIDFGSGPTAAID